MKKLYFLVVLSAIFLTACSKRDYIPVEVDVREWMRTHDEGVVAYVDFSTGNYIVETYNGYSVVESWDGSVPREYEYQYAYFSSRGVQSIYNRSGNYFSKGRIVESWLSWSEALYIIDDMRYNRY
jgi:hypothetical protein